MPLPPPAQTSNTAPQYSGSQQYSGVVSVRRVQTTPLASSVVRGSIYSGSGQGIPMREFDGIFRRGMGNMPTLFDWHKWRIR